MRDFQYAAPTELSGALELLSQWGTRAKILAGGTDILVHLREGHCDAEMVVDVKRIPELMQLECSASGLQLGASVPCCQIYEHPEIANDYPALVDAARIIGGWQIQSRASVGGNLCNSSPAADTIPTLMAHKAVCHIASGSQRRTEAVESFCTGPGRNVLESGELLVALTLPPATPGSASAYERFIPRNEMDIAVAGAASWVQLDESKQQITAARIALAAVAATPKMAEQAGQFLAGQPATIESFQEAAELAKQVASPIDDMRGTAEYRTHLVGVLVKRTLATAVQRATAR